jgi:glucose-6-phosphate 1-dehydrogenase
LARIFLPPETSTSCFTGQPFALACAELARELVPQDLSAYARLLLQVMEGKRELFIRGDEAEESWRIMEPILNAWTGGRAPLLEYAAGSDGPVASQWQDLPFAET